MAKKDWSHWNCSMGSHGEMRCCSCGKKITSGDYRVRQNSKGFITQHRNCSVDDPEWAKRDASNQAYLNGLKERLDAYKAFRDKWNESALDEEIELIEHCLNNKI